MTSIEQIFIDKLFGESSMVGLIGSMNAFDATEETWSSYIERLEIFIDANDIKEEKKVSVLLTVMGLKTYNLVKNLVALAKPASKSYRDIVQLVATHLSPTPSFLTDRYKFSLRNQREHESISDYVVQLKELSMFCEFKDNYLADYLRDRLVSGIRNDAIKKKLLSETELTFEKAVSIATNMEMAERGAATLMNGGRGGSQQTMQIHYTHRRDGLRNSLGDSLRDSSTLTRSRDNLRDSLRNGLMQTATAFQGGSGRGSGRSHVGN